MRQISDINELHSILLEMAKSFHEICVKNDIPYWMLGGTMLGAVRHKGFIPWDDDMDFGIPRKDFNRFIDIAKQVLPSQYELLTIEDSERLLTNTVKIVNKDTIIRETYVEDSLPPIGINIDVFPIDHANDNFGFFSKNKVISFLLKLQGYRFLSHKGRPIFKQVVVLLIKLLFFWLKKRTLIDFINNHLIAFEGSNYANHYGAWLTKENMPKEYMGVPKLYPFEDVQFYGVEDPVNYLKRLYTNYMVIPPEEKRHIHIKEMYWID